MPWMLTEDHSVQENMMSVEVGKKGILGSSDGLGVDRCRSVMAGETHCEEDTEKKTEEKQRRGRTNRKKREEEEDREVAFRTINHFKNKR